MSDLLEKPANTKHKVAKLCPYYDHDCKDVRDHTACWSGLETDDPFPGVCPFVFGMKL